jgi:8-oxo-dGTP diphosphatase
MRRFGEPVIPGRAYRTRPGAYAIIREADDLLVTEQAEPQRELQLPGGGIDSGEGLLHALHRECLEETGWKIAVERRLGAYQRFTFMPEYDLWAHKICHIYLARPTLRVGPPAEDGHRALWMPIATAADLLDSPGDRDFVARLPQPARRRAP